MLLAHRSSGAQLLNRYYKPVGGGGWEVAPRVALQLHFIGLGVEPPPLRAEVGSPSSEAVNNL